MQSTHVHAHTEPCSQHMHTKACLAHTHTQLQSVCTCTLYKIQPNMSVLVVVVSCRQTCRHELGKRVDIDDIKETKKCVENRSTVFSVLYDHHPVINWIYCDNINVMHLQPYLTLYCLLILSVIQNRPRSLISYMY